MNKVANDEKTVKLTRYIITLIISVLVGFILLAVVYLLPVASMRANVEQSYDMLEKEGISSDMIKGYDSTRLDNYSDGLILNSAIYEGNESVLNKAAAVYQYNQKNGNYYTALLTMLKGGSEGLEKGSYARDWHGYLVIIKPLLLFMNYVRSYCLTCFCRSCLLCQLLWQWIRQD